MYVVIAYRWGRRTGHSYLLGVFSQMGDAQRCAEDHADYRGGKYTCVVFETKLDSFDNDEDEYSKEVYIAQGMTM